LQHQRTTSYIAAIIKYYRSSISDFSHSYTLLWSAVCLSVCLMSQLLKPFGGFTRHLTGTLGAGGESSDTLGEVKFH